MRSQFSVFSWISTNIIILFLEFTGNHGFKTLPLHTLTLLSLLFYAKNKAESL